MTILPVATEAQMQDAIRRNDVWSDYHYSVGMAFSRYEKKGFSEEAAKEHEIELLYLREQMLTRLQTHD